MPLANLRRAGLTAAFVSAPLTLLLALLMLLGALPAQAQRADPRADWRSAETAHFRLHYRAEHRAFAEALARIAEPVHQRLSATLDWTPARPTEVVLISESDLANGLTTPLPFNTVALYLAPPEGELRDNSDWLELVFTHEYAHVLHLDQVAGLPGALRTVFGRIGWFFPNVFQPAWVTEGLATYLEGDPAAPRADVRDRPQGRGRLGSPAFEAQLRAEQARGFPSLAELNAQGRRLPLDKAYLYGAYFHEFIARRHGPAAVAALVANYRDNIVPRLHSNPVAVTGLTMDALWDAFLADLNAGLNARSAALRAQPERTGTALQPLQFSVSSVARLADGRTLAVLDDGLGPTWLARLDRQGQRRDLVRVQPGARLSVGADGSVLLTQPDVCDTYTYVYDLYRVDAVAGTLQRLSTCARLLRAVSQASPTGTRLLALQHHKARTRLVALDAAGAFTGVLYEPPAGQELVDVAVSPDGRQISLIVRQRGDWQVLAFDSAAAGPLTVPRTLLTQTAPMHALRHGPAGLELIATADGVPDVWRLQGAAWQRVTRSHTAVLDHAGTAVDGTLALSVLVAGGTELRQLREATALAEGLAPAPVRSGMEASPRELQVLPNLSADTPYAATATLAPRGWWPAVTLDRGLAAYGASITGADALGWHRYAVLGQWETSQRQPLGQIEYAWHDHTFALRRSLSARGWTGATGQQTTTVYDRRTQAQWLGLWPLRLQAQERMTLGAGLLLDRTERIQVADGSRSLRQQTHLAALLLDYDTRGSAWTSEGANRGQRSSLLLETCTPFSGNTACTGAVLRGDVRGYFGIGRSVLALRYTEARAHGVTEPFQLGGATDLALQLGPTLNSRDLALRGYAGSEAALQGANARIASAEWRQPLADIDRHAMVPPVGLNRLSGTLFMDVGGAWDRGQGPSTYRRGVGGELLGEVKLLHSIDLHLRLGLARGLDAPRQTLGYLMLGRAF
jgi:hypothetical protein